MWMWMCVYFFFKYCSFSIANPSLTDLDFGLMKTVLLIV